MHAFVAVAASLCLVAIASGGRCRCDIDKEYIWSQLEPLGLFSRYEFEQAVDSLLTSTGMPPNVCAGRETCHGNRCTEATLGLEDVASGERTLYDNVKAWYCAPPGEPLGVGYADWWNLVIKGKKVGLKLDVCQGEMCNA